MRIGIPEIREQADRIEYRAEVEWSAGSATLWYAVEKEHAGLLTDFSDAALVGLLIPAMAAGEDIHVEGEVSERLWRNLSGPYQRVLRSIIPSLRPVVIHATAFRAPRPRAGGVATGFSGGIDSFCVLADHYYAEASGDRKVTHLLFNNVGSHGARGEQLFRERLTAARRGAAAVGLPLVAVSSNLDAFYGPGIGFQQTHTLRNASVALLLQGGIGRYLYASTYALADAVIRPWYDISCGDPIGLPMLSTDTLEAASTGGEYTRVEKTLRVAALPITYQALDVCAAGAAAGNCSACLKCLRTLLTLEIAGVVDRYARAFHLETYRRKRAKYWRKVLRSRSPLVREVARFAVERDHPLPWRVYATLPFHATVHLARRAVRRAPRLEMLMNRYRALVGSGARASFVLLLAAGCQSAAKYADQHTFGPMLGPCAASMDSVEQARGAPWKKVVGDEEDVQTGQQLFEHEWGYHLDPPSADSVQVVRFRWESDKPGCLVDTRRARRTQGVLLLPWEEAPE